MIGIGIDIARGQRRGTQASNALAPAIEGNTYPGGSFTAFDGLWSAATTSTAMRLESSANGSTGWTDEGTLASAGTWATGLASKYLRLKVTAQPGSVVAYSAVFGPLGLAYDQVLDLAGNTNRLSHTVTAPFIGADLAAATTGASSPGFWFMGQVYYPGSGLKTGATIMSLGDVTVTNQQAALSLESCLWRGATNSASGTTGTIAAAGWYLVSGYFYNSGSNHISKHFIGDRTSTGNTAANAVSLTNFTTLYIGERVASDSDTARNLDNPIAWVAFGRGDPTLAHAWCYNSGALRRVDAYDFAGDATASIDGFLLLSRVSPGNTTFAANQVVDSVGSFNSWSLTGTMAWTARKPGFIQPGGDPPSTASRYIYPAFARTTDSTLTLCINTKAPGAAVAGDFTITSLTHSVAGNIAGTVSGTTFPNPGAGTITGTISGVTVSCEIIAPKTVTGTEFRTVYNGNALVACIDAYPATGAGTTYADAAALKTAIDALASGGTLTINDLAASGSTLTLTAKDYGGATLIAKNRHGVALAAVVATGVTNLTIRGFSCVGQFTGTSGVSGVTLDHCTGRGWYMAGTSGATETFTVTNWIGVDDGTALQCWAQKFNRLTYKSVAHGNTDPSIGVIAGSNQCNTIIGDRVFFGRNRVNVVGSHPDCWKTYLSGTAGYTNGLVMNSVFIDDIETGDIAGQGLFFTDIDARYLRFVNCAAFSSLTNSISMGPVSSGGGIENCSVNNAAFFNINSTSYACYAKDNIRGGTNAVLPVSTAGTETGTVNVASMGSVFPEWTTGAGTWTMWRGPTGAAIHTGAYALIAELAAL